MSSVKLFFTTYLLCFCISSFAATILVHGDSLSAGYGVEQGKDWVSLLSKEQTQHTIINSSLSGETTQGGLNRLPALLATHQPDIVILELGANDGLRGQSLKTMQDNLHAMITLIQAHKARILLLGIKIPPNYGKRYSESFEQVYHKLQKDYQLAFVPFFLEGIAGDSQLMQTDGLHPNEQAQEKILQNIHQSLLPLLRDAP